MELKIVLDFDGVLFNSAFEAYSVCNNCTENGDHYRKGVDFEEFLAFRAYVTDAWQYRRLYDARVYDSHFAALPDVQPDEADWKFAESFFATRRKMMEDPDWPKVMSPYDFFFLLKPLLVEHPEYFYVLSTRDVNSIARTMEF
jgi:FMN phosphatase YigB (HAD superfamily)